MTKFVIPVLLLLACCAMAQSSSGYAALSSTAINQSKVVQDLQVLGYEYVLQKVLFVDNNLYKLPSNFYTVRKVESVESRTSGRVVFYRYTVQLTPDQGSKIIRAIYIVSFNQDSGETYVSYWSYQLIRNRDGPMIADAPSYNDVRSFVNGTKYAPEVVKGVKFTVANAVKNGQMRRGTYQVDQIFSASNSGFSYPYVNSFLLSLVSSSGYTYRAKINVPVTPGIDEKQFPITFTIYPNN